VLRDCFFAEAVVPEIPEGFNATGVQLAQAWTIVEFDWGSLIDVCPAQAGGFPNGE
jgi:hypothetical protein